MAPEANDLTIHSANEAIGLDSNENHRLTVVEKAVFLQGIDTFSQTKTEDLAKIAAIAEEIEYEAGEIVFREKEKGDALFFVVSGEVSLRKRDREIARVYSQGNFGDLALLDNEPREFTAVAAQDSHVLRIGSEEFYELLEDHVEIARAIIKSLTKRIRKLV